MLNQKTYSCGICKTTPDQISHHKSHIETQKHKDKRELFEFKLYKLTNSELEETYKTTNINDIIKETETIIYMPIDKANLLINNKKMKKNISNNVGDTSEDIYNLKNIMIDQSNSVSNKEALKDKIHEIHNYLRNNGAGYGMNALKVFNILYGLKKIEENGLIDKVNLKKPDCEFSYLLKLANENKDEILADLIFGNVLQSICDSELKELIFYEIPQNIRGSVFVYLIKEIDKITIIEKTCNVLLSGKIYEYFIGRDESAISELGAYFTDRHIVEYILSKLDPSINEDGTIPSMIDMFGGSGGFTTGYINFLNEKYPQLINWNTEINKISHFDMNEDVIKSAGLEFFCLTGVFPNMNNLKYKNSFTDEFNGKKYKYPLTNPPYGGDKNNKTEAQRKREKVKEYIKNELLTITDEGLRIRRQKQLKNIEAQEKQEKKEIDKTKVSVPMCSARIQKFAKDNGLKGNDKESCSLMLLMDILEVGGTAIGVLKEGVFFTKTYKDLRKCLVENFNVREVISVPQDQFENTSTKTSIIIFDNTEKKTTEVKFSDLVVEKYTEDRFAEVFGDIVIIENKDDISGVSDKIISVATKEEILSNAICSLNGKDYGKKEIVVGAGYELIKLGTICNNINKKYNLEDGVYNYVEISDISNNMLLNYVEYDKNNIPNKASNQVEYGNILISCVRPKSSKILLINENFKDLKKFVFSSGLANIELKNKDISYYIYAILCILSSNFEKDLCNGSSYPRFSPKILENLEIPIPKSQTKIKEWVDKLSVQYNEKNTKYTKIKELETYVQNKIREIGENEECDEIELGSICEKIKSQFNINTNELDNNGIYPFYNKIGINIGYHSKYNYDVDKCILLTKDGGSGPNIYGDHIALGGVMLISGKFASTYANFVLKPKENVHFIYYLLKNMKNVIMDLANYSVKIGHIQYDKLSKLKIKIPKNKKFIQDLEEKFQKIETLQNEVKIAEELYKEFIQKLSDEAISQKDLTAKEPQNFLKGDNKTDEIIIKKDSKKNYKKT